MITEPKYADLICTKSGQPRRRSFASNMHPNPRFYKYYWLIFHAKSVQGRAFFQTPKLQTYDAMTLIKKLESSDLGFMVYNWHRPRHGANVPFDFASPKWQFAVKAPDFDDDTGRIWNGHK